MSSPERWERELSSAPQLRMTTMDLWRPSRRICFDRLELSGLEPLTRISMRAAVLWPIASWRINFRYPPPGIRIPEHALTEG